VCISIVESTATGKFKYQIKIFANFHSSIQHFEETRQMGHKLELNLVICWNPTCFENQYPRQKEHNCFGQYRISQPNTRWNRLRFRTAEHQTQSAQSRKDKSWRPSVSVWNGQAFEKSLFPDMEFSQVSTRQEFLPSWGPWLLFGAVHFRKDNFHQSFPTSEKNSWNPSWQSLDAVRLLLASICC